MKVKTLQFCPKNNLVWNRKDYTVLEIFRRIFARKYGALTFFAKITYYFSIPDQSGDNKCWHFFWAAALAFRKRNSINNSAKWNCYTLLLTKIVKNVQFLYKRKIFILRPQRVYVFDINEYESNDHKNIMNVRTARYSPAVLTLFLGGVHQKHTNYWNMMNKLNYEKYTNTNSYILEPNPPWSSVELFGNIWGGRYCNLWVFVERALNAQDPVVFYSVMMFNRHVFWSAEKCSCPLTGAIGHCKRGNGKRRELLEGAKLRGQEAICVDTRWFLSNITLKLLTLIRSTILSKILSSEIHEKFSHSNWESVDAAI